LTSIGLTILTVLTIQRIPVLYHQPKIHFH
jgi:hypothetical protein